ncbi:FCD domain-containing protein [Arcanobacterium hippocoleae]
MKKSSAISQRKNSSHGKNSKEFFSLDEQFHELLLNLAGHFRIWQSVTDAKPHLDRARYLGFQKATPPIDFYHQHAAIAAELCAGNIDNAVQLLSTHLRAVFADTDHARQLFPEFFINNTDEVSSAGTLQTPQMNKRSGRFGIGNKKSLEKLAAVRDSHLHS